MSYTPYLIANYATGLDRSLQPWLIPDDAQEQLFDGYVYRGTMSKREGYEYYAIGERGGAPYRESRIIHTLSAVPALQVPNGILVTFTLAATGPIARGSVTVNGSSPLVTGTDNGLGLIGAITGVGIVSGTVNYTTGAISVTFTVAPAIASTVTFTYSFMPGNPVMMIATFITATNVKELIVADTKYVNRYVPTTNILQDISPASAYTGDKFDFFTWVNYASVTNTPRLLFCNNKDVIQQYDGTVVTDYVYTMLTTPTVSVPVPAPVTTLTCSWMAEMKDRLILLRTTENNVIYPQRIRISGTGQSSDDFRTSAIGAGVIDIPDGTWIQGAAFNRDDLLIFTEQSTWVMKYTGNDTTPFILDRIDASRGSDATFGVITYLNRTSAASKRGLIISDGYRVERQDQTIPEFTFDEVDNETFRLCFAGTVDADRDHYLIYPPQEQPSGSEVSKRILVTNYDEDNYSIYRLPLSCMGNFIESVNVTWNDLLTIPNWAAFGVKYGTWNAFSYAKGVPFSIGGGHKGEIWKLAVTEEEDNPVRIYAVTVINDTTVSVTTDWNNYSRHLAGDEQDMGADQIFLTAMTGMTELNDHQFPITQIVNNNTFVLDIRSCGVIGSDLTAYVSGGEAVRVIPFDSLFKKFNPFVSQDKKVRCGWLYMYVNTTGTDLRRNIKISDIQNTNPAIVTTVSDNGLSTGEQVSFFGIGGTTQLNGTYAFVTVIDENNFSLNGVDASGYGVYTSGGYASASELAKMNIEIITNDVGHSTQLDNLNPIPYEGNMTNMVFEDGSKKWYKVFINQTGKFIQFNLKNRQAGANIHIQATMPGFQPVGRMI